MELTELPCCTSTIATVAVILLAVMYYYVKNRNVLPGPTGLPYLGLYPYLDDSNIHLKLDEYKNKYGDLYSFTSCGKLFINMGSIKAIRELHVKNSQCFAEKFSDYSTLTYMLKNGLLMINGEPWKILRKFFVQRFRDYGLNTVKDDMAGPVYDSLNETIRDLKAVGDQPVNVLGLLTQRCTVMIRKVMFGEDGIGDEELLEISVKYGEALEGVAGVNNILIGPFARLAYLFSPKLKKSLQRHDDVIKILYSCARKIEASINDEHPSSCMIEDYYRERNERRRKGDPTWKTFTDESLVNTIVQFVGDGIVGVAAFIAGFLNVLIALPEEQEKLYAELMEVVGPNRQPTIEDKPNLPYANAFVNEVLRQYTFLRIFPSLECTNELTVRGCKIPKGAITLINFYSAHHDPDTFDDPHEFRPSRYMPLPEKPKAESPIAFGIGKRSCSGELLVMTQSFLFLMTIVKNFKLMSSNNADNATLDFLVAGKLEMVVKPRNES